MKDDIQHILWKSLSSEYFDRDFLFSKGKNWGWQNVIGIGDTGYKKCRFV